MAKFEHLNETKKEDIKLMHAYFKRLRTQYNGKILNNILTSLANAFKLSITTIKRVINGVKSKPKIKSVSSGKPGRKSTLDAFDHSVIKQVVTNFYARRGLPTLNLIGKCRAFSIMN